MRYIAMIAVDRREHNRKCIRLAITVASNQSHEHIFALPRITIATHGTFTAQKCDICCTHFHCVEYFPRNMVDGGSSGSGASCTCSAFKQQIRKSKKKREKEGEVKEKEKKNVKICSKKIEKNVNFHARTMHGVMISLALHLAYIQLAGIIFIKLNHLKVN